METCGGNLSTILEMKFLNQLLQSAISIIKLLIKSNLKLISNRNFKPTSDTLIILGNGPSGINDLILCKQKYNQTNFMAVNMFASTTYFQTLKPNFYLVSDHAFFTFTQSEFELVNSNDVQNIHQELKQYQILINQVWHNILNSDWEMTMLIPNIYKNSFIVKFAQSRKIKFRFFNYVVIKGFPSFENFIYKLNWGSPQCQNVINNCIFESIQMNFKNIYLLGVENNFHINTFVDDDNMLKQKDDHFYEVKNKVVPIAHANGTPVKIHEFFLSLHKAFFAHHRLQQYAQFKNVSIYNATKGSFIDAYPRKEIDFI